MKGNFLSVLIALLVIGIVVVLVLFGFNQITSAQVICTTPDHAVYGDVNDMGKITSCLPTNTWEVNMQYGQYIQDFGTHFNALQSVTLKDGRVEMCPFWYWSGCVIDPILIK